MPDFQLVPGSGKELKSEQEALLNDLIEITGYRPVPQLDNRNTRNKVMPNFQLIDKSTKKSTLDQFPELRGMVGETGYVQDPELTKRNTGLALLFMTEVLGYTHEQAWRLVRPSSKATGHSAVSLVTRFIRWYRDNHPLTVMQALEVNGISIETLVKSMKGMLFATKQVWNADKGVYEDSGVPDPKPRAVAFDRIMRLIDTDKAVRRQVVMGDEQSKTELDLPPKFATVQEWEDWAQGQEAETLADREKAAKEMRALAAGQRAVHEGGDPAMAQQLRELAAAEGSSVQALIEEGNGLLFQARGVTINDGSSPP